MPITIKSSRMQYRKSNGDYVGVDAVSERKTSEYVSEIESTGSATQSAIEQTASTARDAIDTKAQQARDSIPSDYTALSDEVSDLKSALDNNSEALAISGDVVTSNINGNYISGGYYNQSGVWVTEAAYSSSPIIDVSKYKKIRVVDDSEYQYALIVNIYDSDMAIITTDRTSKSTASYDKTFDVSESAMYLTVSMFTVAIAYNKPSKIYASYRAYEFDLMEKIATSFNVASARWTKEMIGYGFTHTNITGRPGYTLDVYKLNDGDMVFIDGVRAGDLNTIGLCATDPTTTSAVTIVSTGAVRNKPYKVRFKSASNQYLCVMRGNGYTVSVNIVSPENIPSLLSTNTRENKTLVFEHTLHGIGSREIWFSNFIHSGDKFIAEISITSGGSATTMNESVVQINAMSGDGYNTPTSLMNNVLYANSITEFTVPSGLNNSVMQIISNYTGDPATLRLYRVSSDDAIKRLDDTDELEHRLVGKNIQDSVIGAVYRNAITNSVVLSPNKNLFACTSGACDDKKGNVFVSVFADDTQAWESGTNAYAELLEFNILRPHDCVAYTAIKHGDAVEDFDGQGNSGIIDYTTDYMCAYISSSCVRTFTSAVIVDANELSHWQYVYRDFNPTTKTFGNISPMYVDVNGTTLLMNEESLTALAANLQKNPLEGVDSMRTLINTNPVKLGDYYYVTCCADWSDFIIRSNDCITWELFKDYALGVFSNEVQLATDGTYLYAVNRGWDRYDPHIWALKYNTSAVQLGKVALPIYKVGGNERPCFEIRNGKGYLMIYGDGRDDNENLYGSSVYMQRTNKVVIKIDLASMTVDRKVNFKPEIPCVYSVFKMIGTAMYCFCCTDRRSYLIANGSSDGRQELALAYWDTKILDA